MILFMCMSLSKPWKFHEACLTMGAMQPQ